ncbi:MAG: hypothetical protein J5I90_00370 [Caldilineales bacterium]|nr:hypothetical protein [Caldilineales bacterium]
MKAHFLARLLIVSGFLLLAFTTFLALQSEVQAQGGEDGRGMSMPDRLAPPPMPDNPTQADFGRYDFYLYCMTCHGDRGQGLTEEWRSAWAPGDRNCWQSKCHAANHPPEGFQLPYFIPYVVGKGALARFATADDLFQYVRREMPWHWPGMYDDDIYWKLTAFLAHENGLYTGDAEIGPENAMNIVLWPGRESNTKTAPEEVAATPPNKETLTQVGMGFTLWLLLILIGILAGVFALVRINARKT